MDLLCLKQENIYFIKDNEFTDSALYYQDRLMNPNLWWGLRQKPQQDSCKGETVAVLLELPSWSHTSCFTLLCSSFTFAPSWEWWGLLMTPPWLKTRSTGAVDAGICRSLTTTSKRERGVYLFSVHNKRWRSLVHYKCPKTVWATYAVLKQNPSFASSFCKMWKGLTEALCPGPLPSLLKVEPAPLPLRLWESII